jgi:hypothetical protein
MSWRVETDVRHRSGDETGSARSEILLSRAQGGWMTGRNICPGKVGYGTALLWTCPPVFDGILGKVGSQVLEREGDYAMWGPGIGHS